MENYIVKKAENGEIKKIVKTANAAFIPVRNPNYDFKRTIPKIYKTKNDFSNIHHVIEINNEFVSICGNLIRFIEIDNVKYKFSIVGTVSTIPSYQNHGCMKTLMNSVDNECKNENVVFSMLTGERQRYNFFGFEKAGFDFIYTFSKYFLKHHTAGSISIKNFKKLDCNNMFEIYKNSQIFNLRSKENFIECLSDYRCKIYTIFDKKQFIGYFVVKKGEIIEFFIQNLNLIENIVYQIIEKLNFDELKIHINPLHTNLCFALDKIAQEVSTVDNLHFKIYDTKKFIEMLLAINTKFRKFKNVKETYQIENEIIQISIKDNNFEVKKLTNSKKINARFTKQKFVRFALSIKNNYQINSDIFPVVFGIDICDLF